MTQQHGVTFYEDDMGFWYGACLCKWRSAPMPDREDVADAYGDHRAVTAAVHAEAENERLRAAIGGHQAKVRTLGLNTDRKGQPVYGGEWDRELWAVLDA